MKLQSRLILSSTATVIMSLGIVLTIASIIAKDVLKDLVIDKLIAIQTGRYHALEQQLNDVKTKLNILSLAPRTTEALYGLTQAFNELGEHAQAHLQQKYVVDNLYSNEQRGNFLITDNPDAYDIAHQKHILLFQDYQRLYHWNDVFLIDTRGNIVFSLFKQQDFATNLYTGPWHHSGLARAVLPLLKGAVPNVMGFADFELYVPGHNSAAAFIAFPVFDKNTRHFVGVVATQILSSTLDDLMHDKTGLGESGETFLVGKNRWMLTNSRFSEKETALQKQLDTEPVNRVLRGEEGPLTALDYRGVGSLASIKPMIPFPDALGDKVQWGLITKMDQGEALIGVDRLQHVLLTIGFICSVIAGLIAAWGAKAISRPIIDMQQALSALAKGENISVPYLNRQDELGDMAQAAENFRLLSQQIERSHWLNEHLTQLTNLVSNQSSMKKVPELVLNYLCESLEIPVAALYFTDDQQIYSRVGIHGLARRSQIEDHFELGNGLVGQCARDQKPIVLSPVPEGLSIISAGLAEFTPTELIFYPIQHKHNVLGIVELIALNHLTPHQHELLQAISKNLGLYLANLKAAEHNIALLTETRKQTAALAEQKQIMEEASLYSRSLIEACLDPLIMIGLKGEITDVNTAAEKITGVNRKQLIGSDFCQYFTDPTQAELGYRQVFEQGKVIDYPLIIKHVDGKLTDVLYNATTYLNSAGEVAGIFAAAKDVTELKQQQELLRNSNEEMKSLTEELKAQNEEFRANQEELRIQQEEMRAQQEEMQIKNKLLEDQGHDLLRAREEAEAKALDLTRANQYKSDFLANMSHELRTPLNSILILAKNLSENEEGNLKSDQIESAMVINESGHHLLTLINDILDLSKIEAGHFELYIEEFPLSEIVVYLRRAFMPLVEKKGIGFETEIAQDIPAMIQGDRQRIIQILTNLLSNAVKFTDKGSIRLIFKQNNQRLIIEVIDTGIGIPTDKFDVIFGEFQQADSGTSRKYGGSGLGLAISKRLVELMGGKIGLRSIIGQGSTFFIELPLMTTQSKINTAKPISIPTIPIKKIPETNSSALQPLLLIEDDNRLVSILTRLIESLGFKTVSVDSGEKALEFLKRTRPSGILLDLGLPGMQGIEVLRQLKNQSETKNIPVFIMSGSVDTGEAKTLGAIGFLKKPINKEAILAAIQTMLQPPAVNSHTILVIEDNEIELLGLKRLFEKDAITLIPVKTGKEGLEWLKQHTADAVILDLMLPDINGFEWLHHVDNLPAKPPVIIYSARELSTEELFELRTQVEAVVTKGKHNERLHEEVLRLFSIQKRQLDQQNMQNVAPLSATHPKVLLVDDDMRNLFALSKVLRQKGFEVEIAPSALKALEILPQQPIDILLADIMMPEMDGYALIRKVREMGYQKLPIIAVTAKAMLGDVDLCLQAGANDYIPKPVDINRLLEVMKRWL